MTINKGFYSSLIALLIYNFGYPFTIYGMLKLRKKERNDFKWQKKCYLSFTIIIGILNNATTLLLKDLIISLMNLIIYIGMAIDYFKIEQSDRKHYYKNEAIGVVEIVMMVISIIYITFHLTRYKGLVPNQF